MAAEARNIGYEPRILQEVMQFNKEQPFRMIKLLKKHIPELRNRTIGILGLSFKPGTDDVRESIARPIIEALLKEDAKIRAYDPSAMTNFQKHYPDHRIEYTTSSEVLISDAVLIVTEWDEFEKLDYTQSIVIDGRHVEKAKEARIYEGICW